MYKKHLNIGYNYKNSYRMQKIQNTQSHFEKEQI